MIATTYIALGILFSVGLAADALGRRTRLPRVTLLLICGVIAGESGFSLLPREVQPLYGPLSDIALTMVAFLLGGALTRENLRNHAGAILWVSISVVIATVFIVAFGMLMIGVVLPLALLLGAMATATDPAATQDAIQQTSAKGDFPETLLGIVAIDDAWGMLAFSVMIAFAAILLGNGDASTEIIAAFKEIGGGLLLGSAIGIPSAYLTGRLKAGQPMLTEALGLVFLTAGLALAFEVSYLIAGMCAGAWIVNLARHHDRAFHEIENLEWPFMVLFFVLAGASMDSKVLMQIGPLGLVFIITRIIARYIGGWLGGRISGSPKQQSHLFGLALLPQAGVAVGMALVAAQAFPQWQETLVTLSVGTTVFFELIGPPLTGWAIRREAKNR